MKHLVAALLLSFLVAPTSAHAFKWTKCKKVYKPWGTTKSKTSNPLKYMGDQLAQLTSQATSQSTISTSSYVTSTGDCAAFAKAEEDRNQYIAQTFTEIRMEAAEGQGDHVSSLATLYGCDSQVKTDFANMLKKNHNKIFQTGPIVDDSAIINQRITESLTEVESLRHRCNLERI